ncbi:retron St85 family RNA-directed DNA polymerase [Alkalimonas collagenimarina]|uniref:RNA-directed DNA polymerase n=1 Tax=Alkalimonas collagenimarina TaxID=400390 RepID=A0ABT9H0Y5_9GAMM|nr:retron St85 family RNA-directed DNA polymerase [Alkalimonas collagenimarina]MDP4536989.1 retron St85 family RNA-directed DNA polymerase [Alkalimonas collagenimarina]
MSIVTALAKKLNKSEYEVSSFLLDAPKKYKVYSIPKRKHGHRVIAQPSKELKSYQRAFIELSSSSFPIHDSAKAYIKGIGIRENALLHSKNSYLLKMDFENFFNSINKELFWRVWDSVVRKPLSDSERRNIDKIIFWQPNKKNRKKLVLSIGAPSSPMISNFCMYEFDSLIADLCFEHGINYSRYADDITFSTNVKDVLFDIPKIVQSVLKKCFGMRMTINHSKTAFSSRAHNRHVTGVTISNDGQLSLGRKRKRYIKHLVYQYLQGNLDLSDINYLKGIISFANHIESGFLQSLKNKHPQLDFNKLFEAVNEQK